ncbi:MAG: O-antigen ligase family protein [Solirubrobacteraceae bacterium]
MAVGLAVIDDGGFSEGSRTRFAVVALLAAAAATWSDPARARRFARQPVPAILLVLAVLGAISMAWTVGIAHEALHWAFAVAGFALTAFASAILIRDRRDAAWAAALIAVLAVAMSVVGLVAAAIADEPYAHRQGKGLWRPAATFQYSPALALLIVSALPGLISGLCHARRWWQTLAVALGAAIVGAALSLTDSRTQIAFALVAGATALWRPERLVGASRREVGAALALVAAAGLGAYAVAGGYVPLRPPPDGTARLLAIAAVVAGAALAWTLLRARLAPAVLAALLLATGTAGAIAKPTPIEQPTTLVVKAPAGAPAAGPAVRHPIRDKLLHGRLHIWGEAVETFADRPLYGGGADSYWFASADHQGIKTVFYAHELPLELAAELGIAGLLLALGLYGTAGRAIWRGRAGPAEWLLGPAAAAFLAANLVDWPWHLAGSGAVWALALGAMIGTSGATQDRH